MPTLSFQATFAKNRATWAASDDGMPLGLRSRSSDISFMISDILRGWPDMSLYPFLSYLAAVCRFDFNPLALEPFQQALLQSSHRLGQCLGPVVLEGQSAVVQCPDHEPEHLLVADLDVAVAPHPLGDGRE